MRIGYSSSLWDSKKRGKPAVQRLDWRFEHLGLRRCIPCVYHFRKGIVFDLLTLVDERDIRAYRDRYEGEEERLSSARRRCAEQESPFRELELQEIRLNGRESGSDWSSSGAACIPFLEENPELGEIREAYPDFLGEDACFHCQRYRLPYPADASLGERLLRLLRRCRLRSLELLTREARRFYPLELSFTLSENSPEKELGFTHPVSGVGHRLWFRLGKAIRLPGGGRAPRPMFAWSAEYEIEPPLPPEQRLEFDSSCTHASSSGSASSVGIIGGSCGPTAVFMVSRKEPAVEAGPHGLPLVPCLSLISREEAAEASFLLQGLDVKVRDGQRYTFAE